jgi:pimeloyl-ACP methyl ester carboxylesterase
MAEDLADAVHRLCDGQAVVMGHSMGGKAAMALALRHPELLSGIVIADIAPVGYPHTHMAIVQAMRRADLSGITRRSGADALLAPVIADAGLRAFLLQNLVIEDGGARWRLNLAALEAGMDTLTGWPEIGESYGGPALFIYGGASDYMDPSRESAVRALFPAADFAEIAGAGHWLHAEKPAEFLAALSGWLDVQSA